jgi:hypothetical protein
MRNVNGKNLQLEIQKFSKNILLEILKKSYIFQGLGTKRNGTK